MTIWKTAPTAWIQQSSHKLLYRGDCDCDCDSACDGFTRTAQEQRRVSIITQAIRAETIQSVALNRDTYFGALGESSLAALGPKSDRVVVLGDGAKDFLFSLKEPSDLFSLRSEFSAWSKDVFNSAIGLLLVTGVLSSPQLQAAWTYPQSASEVLVAWLHLTDQCNLACAYCYVIPNARKMSGKVAQRAVDSLFRSAARHGYSRIKIKYAGGEPTLNFETLLAAQSHAETLSAQTGITLDAVLLTNGVTMSDTQIEALLSHDIRVMLSLDGLGRYQDRQRYLRGSRQGSFEAVSHTLDRLIAFGLKPHISVTITGQSLHGLPTLVDYLLERHLHFGFNFYRAAESESGPADLTLEPDTLIEGLIRTLKVIERRLPEYSLLSMLTDRANLQLPHTRACGVGQNYMVIDCEGNISQCQMDLRYPVTSIVDDDPLATLQACTDGIQNLSVDQRECQECLWRYRCAGGCPRLTFQHSGRYDAKSPLCEVYQAILPEVVRLEALRLLKYEESWDFSTPN